MNRYIIDTLAIVTTILLLIFSLFLLTLKKRNTSHILLSVFLFSNAIYIIDFLLPVLVEILNVNLSALYGIGFSFGFLFGPLLYLYTRSITLKDFTFDRRQLVHFFVFGIIFLIKLFHLKFILPVEYLLLHIQIFPYMLVCFFSILSYRQEIKKYYSAIEHLNLTWLLYVVGAFFIMWMLDLFTFLIYELNDAGPGLLSVLTFLSLGINFVFSILIFFKAIRNPEVFSGIPVPVKGQKYEKSRLTEPEKQEYISTLENYFRENKPYLDSKLSISDVAEKVDITVRDISQIINESFKKNFYDFINSYRIDEAKQMLTNVDDEKKTVLEILYEVGFNSKSAFNTAFKKHTGVTPTDFRHQKTQAA